MEFVILPREMGKFKEKKTRGHQKGFTLVEIILILVIVGRPLQPLTGLLKRGVARVMTPSCLV